MSFISFKNFSFRYDNLKEPTLNNINLDIHEGEMLLIAGPSGSGKSTLAHCINGLIPFTYKGEIKGSLEIASIRPYEKSIYEISQMVGTILQDQDGQFVGLSVGEDVAFAYENNNVPQREMHEGVMNALREVDMVAYINESPHNLSGGQKQKVSLAGILATNAPILLFDEPLANLDPASSKKAMETISNIHKQTKKTVIIIEHRIEEVLEQDVDRIILINEGKIIADCHPDVLLTTDFLPKYGLREPLYIEVLKKENMQLTFHDRISNISNAIKYKDNLLHDFEKEYVEKNIQIKKSLLTLEHVSFTYDKNSHDILHDLSLDIRENEVLSILGYNGAGKSTLLKVISGIVRQQQGTIKYLEEPIDKWSIKRRAEIIGYVMQNPNHMITQTIIFDEVAFGLRNAGCSKVLISERVENALRICGLYKYRNWPISSLSFGQKKRVTIASILAIKPKIIFLDEPTAGQDHRNYREFMQFLEKIKESGVSIVMITHDMHLSLEYADRALVLSEGKIIAEDSVYNILSDKSVMEKANLKETSLSKLARLYGVSDVSSFLAYYTAKLKGSEYHEQIGVSLYP